MKKFIKESIKVIIALVCGLIIGTLFVNADILLGSSNVSIDNTNMGLTKNGHGITNVQDAIEAIYTTASTVGCPSGYEMVSVGNYALNCRTTGAPICKRATTLHTETCNQTNYFCHADGYYIGGTKNTTTITYGNLGTLGQPLTVGDAFDCDVNGDGLYNSETERFYYVSDYYDTNTQSFDNTRATLIYYRNYKNSLPSDAGVAYYGTESAYDNWHGPTTAIASLPSTTGDGHWRNDLLKTQDRKILSCDDASCTTLSDKTDKGNQTITYTSPVYNGKAARLLTLKELVAGCGPMSTTTGEITQVGCNFLLERTRYTKESYVPYGPWLENPIAFNSTYAWRVYSGYSYVHSFKVTDTPNGARPTIDVLYSNIVY